MQDRPTTIELLKGVEYFLTDEAIVELRGNAQFHARVASYTIRMILRELEGDEDRLAVELEGLRDLLETAEPSTDRLDEKRRQAARLNEALAEKIRRGEADDGEFRRRVLDHLRRTIVDKLEVTNPKMAALVRDELAGGGAGS